MTNEQESNYYQSPGLMDKFDSSDPLTYPVLVVASSISAGIEYANIIGIEGYVVANTLDRVQGLRIRAIVVTPQYLRNAQNAHWEAMAAYEGGMQNLFHTINPVKLG